MGWLTDPYQSDLMRHAALTATLVGVLAPAVGVWVVLRRLAYLGDAMSHGTLAGVAGAYLAGIDITIGALAAGLALGLLVAASERQRRISHDTAIGVAETLLFALGVILVARSDRAALDLTHYLFGQIVTVDGPQLAVAAGLTAAALATLALTFVDLRHLAFDPLHARQVGVPVGWLNLVLIGLLSVTVVVCLRTVGLLMSVALLVTPAAGARLLTERVGSLTALAVAAGTAASLGGLTLAWHLATPPGPTIALAAVAWFALAATLAALRGRRRHLPRPSA